ncbi:membrane protein [Clostridioides difficile]|uniref:ABC transporter, permease protein n=4 Tax=Clostridioides difficile TaxID=1496 RepID=A0A9R0BL51_CLODR|nr:ABC-2 transporter permease [Clostridioides difficile]OFT99745.1 ABC transporter permease [Clostridium sp. HMSC19E03]OFU14574.1 ABC transporter permease [Clostridium sp. HMSC19C09]OFU18752.1 ABC transporter permease [Clostridium sp. HMSC19C08]OFU19993.1 ABC transporter permease [Clostridium sp. HMSC19C05]OFU27343.1 ABC transporter permease [Clostridium sp. HMSC19B11]OFU29430.1 ABC transporter permease [Clostridium sp. HMSC19B10]OFU38016.1 ABC transporter permease [Clostridium sp. HMSC19B01
MKGLILKDLLNLKGNVKFILLFIIMFGFMSSLGDGNVNNFIGVIIVLCTTMIVSTFSYDDLNKWDSYVLTMPINRNDIVLSKYLTMLIFSFIGVLVSLIVSVTIGYFKNTLILNETLLINALILSISVCFGSLILPLIYKFGTERARLLMILCFLVPTLALLVFKSILENISSPISIEIILNTLVYSLPFVAILLFVISYFISSKIYSKKEV